MTSAIYRLSDEYIERTAELDPGAATYLGIAGHDHEMTDFSPAGHAARGDLDRSTLAALDGLAADTDDDRLAAGVLREALETSVAEHAAGEHLRAIRIIAGDVDSARSVFDLMPMETAEHWSTIAERLDKVPAAFAGMRESWSLGISRGVVAPRRQALAVAQQLEDWSGRGTGDGFFGPFVEQAAAVHGAPIDALRRAADSASAALAETATYLRSTYVPKADPNDGIGPDRHALARRRWLGMETDAAETYAWGWQEVRRIDDEIRRVGERILPGGSPAEVRALLDTDPARAVHGEDALRGWLQQLMDEARDFLVSGGHFDIPESIRACEAMIAPPGGAAAMYYTGPSEDLSRPGRTWYPANGRTVFPRWGEPTTAYHEGVPGHHLQVATATINRDRLSRFQRNTFVSGHGEGWALYAERLMDELGFFANDEYRLGYLYAQAFRAARVVIDIGAHCDLPIAADSGWHPGERWTPELMLEFLSARSSSDDAFNRSEIDRYLGWPAQAISYKVGERVWLDLRDDAKSRLGSGFDIRAWHAHGLRLGNLGLDLLKREMARFGA